MYVCARTPGHALTEYLEEKQTLNNINNNWQLLMDLKHI